jgi:uncharacterized protein (TIGR00369 family)
MSHPKLTLGELRELLPKLPFNKLLGMKITRLHPDGVTVECAVRDDLRNLAGGLHGGVFATLADAAAGVALQRHFGGKRPIATVELKINYLRAVTEGRVFARARLIRAGATLCVSSVDLTDEHSREVGAALVTYILLDRRGQG